MAALETTQLLTELEPVVEDNLNRHLSMADEWMPHEYVPWSLGRDFADLGGDPWEVAQSQLSPIARTALEVNLLTEDSQSIGLLRGALNKNPAAVKLLADNKIKVDQVVDIVDIGGNVQLYIQ